MTFIATSEVYMLLSFAMHKRRALNDGLSPRELKAVRLKGLLCLVNIVSFACAGFCFVRHNRHCEPGVYTLFALFEYVVVLTNMGFHITACLDFAGQSVAFDKGSGFYLTRS